jgi:hypothetical protein
MGRRGFDAVTGVSAVIDASAPGGPAVDSSLHVDADSICPRCLSWIGPTDFVRRTLFDLVQHETCPPSHREPALV